MELDNAVVTNSSGKGTSYLSFDSNATCLLKKRLSGDDCVQIVVGGRVQGLEVG